MAPANFRPIFPATTKDRFRSPSAGLGPLLKDSFALPTLLVLGGLGQAAASFILPSSYALLPLLFLLLRAVILTVRDIRSPAEYAARRNVISERFSAQLPNDSYDPTRPDKAALFGTTPAEKGVVAFHLGARFNHPLGALGPGSKEFAQQFQACHRDLLKRAKEYGCLSGTSYRSDDAASHNTIMTVYYFRNLDGLNRFAHDPIHRQAWDWYNKVFVKEWGYSHIGIFHEAFCAPAGAYETIYVNMPPLLMASGSASIRNEATGEDEWVRTVVDATTPAFRTQHSRMGREVKRQSEAEKN